MSYIKAPLSAGTLLVRDAFPPVVRLASDKSLPRLDAWEVVPGDHVGKTEWARIISIPRPLDSTRPFAYVYLQANGHIIYEVSIKIYGVLGRHNFDIFGNWNGQSDGGPRAMQFLHLEAGPYGDLFREQAQCLVDIKALIISTLRSRNLTSAEYEELRNRHTTSISMNRRVFTKIDRVDNPPPSVITAMDDPAGRLQVLGPAWRVVDKPSFGRRLATGRVKTCASALFRPGDFVCANARFDIAVPRKDPFGVPTVSPHLFFTHVVQLCPEANTIEEMQFPAPALAANVPLPVTMLSTPMLFDGDDDMDTQESEATDEEVQEHQHSGKRPDGT
ncbi:hypothetical protein OF83DRAFT_1120099 [Amylostereum chailletii]|nr:hypothetical protein OF83DRAFT_1120099 [Amylostereum chailletii]